MGYPELYSDEKIILQAQNIKVKSVSFEGILTTRRLVLIDSKKNTIPPQEINLATLRDVEAGENAIRDPTITISIITISGNTRQMILTFSKTQGGERRRECDEWVRTLKQHLTSSIQHPVSQDVPAFDQEPKVPPKPSSTTPRKIEIANSPQQKKKIEIARPMKKIADPVPSVPIPVETTSLPTGSFCSRCGNRIPPESAFCNRCGTAVLKEGDFENLPETPAGPRSPPNYIPPVSVQVMPATETDKKERPIEQVIHSIEPLIEDSVPRTEPSPLVPSRQTPSTSPQWQTPQADAISELKEESPSPSPTNDVKWPVLFTADSPVPSLSPDSSSSPPPPPPGPVPGVPLPPAHKKPTFTAIAVLAIVIIIAIAGAFVFMNSLPGSTNETASATMTPTVVPQLTTPSTPVPTAVPTTIPVVSLPPAQPAFSIPPAGVWVRVSYLGKFTGSVGTPGRLRDVTETGDHLYQISTSEGPVVASIQKVDGSEGELVVEVYKDGVQFKRATTIAPKGMIEIQMLLKPAVRSTTAPVTTAIPAGANASVAGSS
jgi:ribosomal protein L40E